MTYLLMAALAALTFAWLSRPLWQRLGASPAARRAANVAAYDSRLAEIAGEQTAGLLTEDEANALRQELAHRLLSDASSGSSPSPAQGTAPRAALAGLLALACAAAAGVWYWQAGSWRTASLVAAAPPATVAAATTADGPTGAPEVQAMVEKLAKRLESDPDNAEGWAMLGRSYTVMQRYQEAADAYGKANGLSKADGNAEWLVGEGEALALARNRDLMGRPAQLFDAALALDPRYDKALWYGALAAEQGNDKSTAKARFTALLKSELPEEIRVAVQAKLAGLDGLPPPVAAAPTLAASSEAAPDPLPAESMAAANPGQGLALAVNVTLAPALADKILPNAVLFVFAKAAKGPPMPLAVQRLPGAKLPLSLKLDDSMGMIPTLKLSQFDRWVVTARYSGSGTVQAASGDLQGSVTVTKDELGKPLNVVIAEQIP